MKKFSLLLGSAIAVLLTSCSADVVDNEIPAPTKGETITLEVSLANTTRAQLGDKVDGKYPMVWNAGDQLSVFNGNGDPATGLPLYFVSDALSADYEGKSSAKFTFQNYQDGQIGLDFIMYPAGAIDVAMYTATIPVEQKYVKGSYAKDAGILFGATGSIKEGGNVTLAHMCAYVKVPITKQAGLNVTEATFKAQQEEQVAGQVIFGQDNDGEFALLPKDVAELPEDNDGNKIGMTVKVTDIEWVNNTAEVVFAVMPGTYAKGFEVSYGTETKKAYSTNGVTLKAGEVLAMPGVKTKADVKIEFSNITISNADVKITLPEGTGNYTIYAASLGYNKDAYIDRFNAELPGKILDGTSSGEVLDAAGFNGTLLDLYRLFMGDDTIDGSSIKPDQTWIVAVNPAGNEDVDLVSYGLVTLQGYTLGTTTADVKIPEPNDEDNVAMTPTSINVKIAGISGEFKAHWMTKADYDTGGYEGDNQKLLDFVRNKTTKKANQTQTLYTTPTRPNTDVVVVVFAYDPATLVGKIMTKTYTAPNVVYSTTLKLKNLEVQYTGVNYAEVKVTAEEGEISTLRYGFMKKADFEANATLAGDIAIAEEQLAVNKTVSNRVNFKTANLKADGVYSIENMYTLESDQYLFVIACDADGKPSNMVHAVINTNVFAADNDKFDATLTKPAIKGVYHYTQNNSGHKKALTEWTNMNTVTDVTTLDGKNGMYWLDLDWSGTTAMKRMWLCNENLANWNELFPITGTDMKADATSVIKKRVGNVTPDFYGLNTSTGALYLTGVQVWNTSEHKNLRNKIEDGTDEDGNTIYKYTPKTIHLVWETTDGKYGYMPVVPEDFCATANE